METETILDNSYGLLNEEEMAERLLLELPANLHKRYENADVDELVEALQEAPPSNDTRIYSWHPDYPDCLMLAEPNWYEGL